MFEQLVQQTNAALRLQLAFNIEQLEMEFDIEQLDAEGDGRFFQELKALRAEGVLV